MTSRRFLWLASILVITAGSCSPTQPSTATVTLRSVRYVRTVPVTGGAQSVRLGSSIPIGPDPSQGRIRLSEVPLSAVDEVTFTYDSPSTFNEIPIDTECIFWITDPAVSPFYVATDIYLNETRVSRIVTAGNYQYGHVKITRDGHLY
jgi:hypothetical protein